MRCGCWQKVRGKIGHVGVSANEINSKERKMKTVRATAAILGIVAVTVLLQGCYEEQQVVIMRGELIPMSQQDVVQMVKDGVPNTDIIGEIQSSGTVFRLSAGDIEYLKSEGVPEEVINVMLETREAPPALVQRTVMARPTTVVVRDPWWGWDPWYGPGYYYYPAHVGLSFSYTHFGGHRNFGGYGIHYRHYR